MVVYELLMDESMAFVCAKSLMMTWTEAKSFSHFDGFSTHSQSNERWEKMRHWIQMQFLMHDALFFSFRVLIILELGNIGIKSKHLIESVISCLPVFRHLNFVESCDKVEIKLKFNGPFLFLIQTLWFFFFTFLSSLLSTYLYLMIFYKL